MSINVPAILQPKEDDMAKLVIAMVHMGTTNVDQKMKEYVWKKRADGVNIINLGKFWEKLMLAARIIASIENPQDVVVICSRQDGQRAALKFSENCNSQVIAGRYTPGTFTNQITKQYKEPRLIIVTDPRLDYQAIKEASLVNIPVIAICDTDASLKYVDVAIPANNKTTHSIGLVYWLLAREVLRLKGVISRDEEWSTKVDLFFFRDLSEIERAEETAAASELDAVVDTAPEGGETGEDKPTDHQW